MRQNANLLNLQPVLFQRFQEWGSYTFLVIIIQFPLFCTLYREERVSPVAEWPVLKTGYLQVHSLNLLRVPSVVYFDQQMCAPHTVSCSKSFVFVVFYAKTTFSVNFCQKMNKKCMKKTKKHVIKGALPTFMCLFSSASDGKSCFNIKKLISTSKQCAQHPFAGQNKQHLSIFPQLRPIGYCWVPQIGFKIRRWKARGAGKSIGNGKRGGRGLKSDLILTRGYKVEWHININFNLCIL